MTEAPPPPPEQDEKFVGPDDIPLQLWRMRKSGQPPVLLLHGASAQHETFCIPRGNSLADYLWRNGYEPWLLDWRGSRQVMDALERAGKLDAKRDLLDFDQAASKDVPLALEFIRNKRGLEDGQKPVVHVVAHCMGAGVLAQAIASGHVPKKSVGRVVLLTLGLFYVPPTDGKLKSTFRVLDDLWRAGSVSVIDPRKPQDNDKWPRELREIYAQLGRGSRPHSREDIDWRSSHALCNRLSFLYGTPYLDTKLVPEIHGVRHVRFEKGRVEPNRGERLRAVRDRDNVIEQAGVGYVSAVHREPKSSWGRGDAKGTFELSGAVGKFDSDYALWADDGMVGVCLGKDGDRDDLPPQLGRQFGAIPLRMYLQGALNVRRTWAGRFEDSEGKRDLIDDPARLCFHPLEGVTLITGEDNRLWHRRSINEMYQWLIRGPQKLPYEVHMTVIPKYAHQDLLWGKEAENDVFSIVLNQGLGGPGKGIAHRPEEPRSAV